MKMDWNVYTINDAPKHHIIKSGDSYIMHNPGEEDKPFIWISFLPKKLFRKQCINVYLNPWKFNWFKEANNEE